MHVDSTDSSLIERLCRGDRAALGVLYERYASDVKRVTWALLRDESHADDAVQEVFLEAWRKADSFDASRGTVRAWLIVRARSRCLDRLRKSGRRAEVEWEGQGSYTPATVEQYVDTIHLPRAFSCVNDQEREVLLLGYFEGLTSAEIAIRLDLPQGTVKSRTRTAMEKMREFLERGKK
jgi:RNA polymerase sigma-70 factor (ECF subfamily)